MCCPDQVWYLFPTPKTNCELLWEELFFKDILISVIDNKSVDFWDHNTLAPVFVMLDEKRPKQFMMNENYASSQLGLVIEVKSASKYVRLTGPSWHHWTFELICVLKSMMLVTASLEIDRMKFEENVKICFRAPPPVPTSFSVSSSHGAHCSLTWMQGVAFYSGHYPGLVNWWQVMLAL